MHCRNYEAALGNHHQQKHHLGPVGEEEVYKGGNLLDSILFQKFLMVLEESSSTPRADGEEDLLLLGIRKEYSLLAGSLARS